MLGFYGAKSPVRHAAPILVIRQIRSTCSHRVAYPFLRPSLRIQRKKYQTGGLKINL